MAVELQRALCELIVHAQAEKRRGTNLAGVTLEINRGLLANGAVRILLLPLVRFIIAPMGLR